MYATFFAVLLSLFGNPSSIGGGPILITHADGIGGGPILITHADGIGGGPIL